jgi:ribosomal protein S18 acetylase RimI-like enzyme
MRNDPRFPGADGVVAETDGEIVGLCLTARERSSGAIITMDVLAEYRRQGVGTLLLAEAERRLAANGLREGALETATDHAAAIACWQKHGYRTCGVKRGDYPGGRDALSMATPLAC